MTRKTFTYSLGDSSVIAVDANFQAKWKHYGDDALFVAILSAMFPFLVPVYKDSMYARSLNAEGKSCFIAASIATSMVYDRYGKYPHELFDFYFAEYKYTDAFRVYESKRTPFMTCEGLDNYAVREFTISDPLVDKIGRLFCSLTLVPEPEETPDDSDTVMVDTSTSPDDFAAETVVRGIEKPACTECQLCEYVRILQEHHDSLVVRKLKIADLLQDPNCQRTRFNPPKRSFGIFAWCFEGASPVIRRFGNSFLPKDAVPPDRQLSLDSRIRKGRIVSTWHDTLPS
nr:MAG: hypothetical protein [Aspergillus flavus partitivirus 1]BED98286.1 MAG: hypothetical protein [Aspergillus flavus partitivirus 1]BED98325.1 MAG: hypothetical protein [Aspergillus flavus partitivirus 1]